VTSEDLAMVLAVVCRGVDGVRPGVDPVHPLCGQVESQPVRPSSVSVCSNDEDYLSGVWISGHIARLDSEGKFKKVMEIKFFE